MPLSLRCGPFSRPVSTVFLVRPINSFTMRSPRNVSQWPRIDTGSVRVRVRVKDRVKDRVRSQWPRIDTGSVRVRVKDRVKDRVRSQWPRIDTGAWSSGSDG